MDKRFSQTPSPTLCLLPPSVWLLLGLTVFLILLWQLPNPSVMATTTIMTLPTHIFCETFSIAVSIMVFAIAYAATEDRPLPIVVLGCAFLMVGLLDFAHLLSFKGMPDFITPASREKGLNFWLAARAIFAFGMLLFALLPWKPFANPRTRSWLVTTGLLGTAIIYWLGLYHQSLWPRTFIEGQGLTVFKVGAEYAIVLVMVGSALCFYRQKKMRASPYDAAGLATAVGITILSELIFSRYSEVTDLFNLVGHLYKILAYIFIYRAIVVASIHEPIQKLHQAIEALATNERSLRENKTTLHQILNTVPQSIFWKDLDSVYLGCNQVFAKAVGFADPNQIKGKTDFDLPWPREEAEAYRADDLEVIQKNLLKRHIIEPLQQADGSRLWIDTSKLPLLDESGKPFGVVGVYEDITERIRAEEQREEMETRLRQSQKMEAIGTLAGGIAHDFNNLLQVIFAYTELALAENDPQERQQELRQVRLGAERARELVQQILTFSRRTEEEKQPLQISSVIKEALKMLRSSIPSTIRIKQEIASPGVVLADPTMIHQVIMNLCTNGYHAMRDTGGVLSVSLTEIEIKPHDDEGDELGPGQYLKLAVSDTGVGISPEIRDKIFEPYFTTKKTGEGTGLGLAVVHGIIKNHRGHIAMQSVPGVGTTFSVYLPLLDKPAAEPQIKNTTENLLGQGEQILFVDDEAQIREFANRLLTNHGYRVKTLANGLQAWEEFKKIPHQYDLVITDLTMPHLTGIDLTRKILEVRSNMPIILCTGQDDQVNREKALTQGACDYLSKPVGNHDFLTAIRRALADRGA